MIDWLSKPIWRRRDSYHHILPHHSTLLREIILGSCRPELKQRLYRNASDGHAFLFWLNYLFLLDQAHLPSDNTACLDLDILYQLIVKKMSHICAHRSIWLRHYSVEFSLFPCMSNWQAIITITSLSFFNLSNKHVKPYPFLSLLVPRPHANIIIESMIQLSVPSSGLIREACFCGYWKFT